MDKSKICYVIGMICTMVGAFIINEGLGMIVTGAWFLVTSYAEYTREEEAKEETKVLRDPWHPTCQKPDRDADIIFRNSKNRLFEPVKFYIKSLNVYTADNIDPYNWEGYCETFVYDEWAYIDDIIKS